MSRLGKQLVEAMQEALEMAQRDPQGVTVTREHPSAPIRLRLWWNGVDLKEQPSVTLSRQAAHNLAIDLLLAMRNGE